MDVIITVEARKQLDVMPKVDARRLETALRQIAETHPQRMAFVTELAGRPGSWRARKGDYRAVFRITETAIVVISVGHRKDIYE